MDEVNARKENIIYLSSYIFITIVLGGFGIYGFYLNWKANQLMHVFDDTDNISVIGTGAD